MMQGRHASASGWVNLSFGERPVQAAASPSRADASLSRTPRSWAGYAAQRFKTPYPIVCSSAAWCLPGADLPRIALNPMCLPVVLPPLLYIGVQHSWRDFQTNLVSILMLAFGLVGFGVGSRLGKAADPGFDYAWRRSGAVV